MPTQQYGLSTWVLIWTPPGVQVDFDVHDGGRGCCGLIFGLQCTAVCAALMVSVIDTSSPSRARSSRTHTGSSRFRGTRFSIISVKSLAQPFDDPSSVKR